MYWYGKCTGMERERERERDSESERGRKRTMDEGDSVEGEDEVIKRKRTREGQIDRWIDYRR